VPTSTVIPRPRSALTQIMAIMLGLLLPAFAYAGYLIAHHAATERSRYHSEAVEIARRTVAAIDRELSRQLLVLKVMALSPLLREGRIAEFYPEALAAKQLINAEIVVKNDEGHHLINTRRPWGEPMLASLTDADRRALASDAPTISDLYRSSLVRLPIVSVAVPARLGDLGKGLVNTGILPTSLVELLQQQGLPDVWTVAIVDGNDRIVARSQQHRRYFGELATQDLRANATGQDGVWIGTSMEGAPVLQAYARSQIAPSWRVAVSIPNAELEQPLQRSLISLVLVGFVTLGGAVMLAGWFGERLARSLSRLAEDARRLGEGSPLPPRPSPVLEVDAVGRALTQAAVDLKERTRALAENERRLRLTLEAGNMGAWDWDLSTDVVRLDEVGCRLWGVDPAKAPPLVTSYFELVDPLDIEALKATLGKTIERNQPYRHEFRIRLADGRARWLAGRGVLIGDDQGRLTRMIGVNFDVTESKLAEQRLADLLAELNHRVKNSLAVLDAIASRTMLDARTPEAFFEAFSGRLSALASSHALLAESGWLGVDVGRLVESQTAPYAGGEKGRIHCSGPLVQLGSDLSLALAFVLHELATNAAKHGALSVPTGQLDVSWERVGANGAEALQLIWAERDGPPVVQPTRQGYGSRLISESLGYTFKGEVTQRYAPEGLTTEIRVPLA